MKKNFHFFPIFISLVLATLSDSSLYAAIINVPADQPSISAAVAAASPGDEIRVASILGAYDEQVVVNKGVTIKGVGPTQPTVDFTGTVMGKPTLFDVTADGVTIENIHFSVDLSKLRSAIIVSGALIDNIAIKDNTIDAYGTPIVPNYGDRNAVSVNYSGATNYRVATGGVDNVVFTGNTISGSLPSAFFRSGISADEVGGTFSNNTSQTINHDILVRFGSNGNITIDGNTCNGGGIEVAEYNAGAGNISITNNNFDGTASNIAVTPRTALLRLKNNQQNKATTVSGNTFTNHRFGLSIENYPFVTVTGNTFTPESTSTDYVHIGVNTKSISSNSNTIVQTQVDGTFTNNIFNGATTAGGTALGFYNHDSDAASFGTFTIGTVGNENAFNANIAQFIRLDNQTGGSGTATTPTNYPDTGNWPTTMSCWNQSYDIQNNKFDVGAGLQLPLVMTSAQRATLEGRLFHKPDDPCLGALSLGPSCGDDCGMQTKAGTTISTQTQLNNFLNGTCKVTHVTGNLILDGNGNSGTGNDIAGADPITDLCVLSELVSVGGNLIIRDFNVAGNPNSLAALANLTTVGGNLTIGSTNTNDNNGSFTGALSLPALTSVGGTLTINQNPNITSISIPTTFTSGSAAVSVLNNTSVTSVALGVISTTGNVAINTNGMGVTNISMPNLASTGGNLDLGNTEPHATQATLNFPVLTSVGGALTLRRTVTGALSLPMLTQVTGNLIINQNTNLTSVSIPGPFTGSTNSVSIEGNGGTSALTSIVLGVKSTLTDLNIHTNGTALTAVNLDKLTTVGRYLEMNNAAAHDVSATAAVSLAELTETGGRFRLVRAANTLSAPMLTHVGTDTTLTAANSAFTLQRSGSALVSMDDAVPVLTYVGGNLSVTNNPELGQCCVIPCQLTHINGVNGPFNPAPNANPSGVSISGNKPYGDGGRCVNKTGPTTSGFNVAKDACQPTEFAVTASEDVCPGAIELDGSQEGVVYKLWFFDNLANAYINTGTFRIGDGNPLTFDNITLGGSYRVIAVLAGGCEKVMGTVPVSPGFALMVDAPETVTCGEEIEVCVRVGCGISDLASLQIALQWDDAVFEYVAGSLDTDHALPGLPFTLSIGDSVLRCSWFDLGIDGKDLEQGDTILCFKLKVLTSSGSSEITFVVAEPGDMTAIQTNFEEFDIPITSTEVLIQPIAVTCPPSSSVCLNDGSLTLAGGTPAGGEYEGDHVTGGVFNMATAGVGPQTISYTVTDEDSECANTCTFVITVVANPGNAFRPAGQPFINPAPGGKISFDANHEICAGAKASYGTAQPGGGHSFAWSIDPPMGAEILAGGSNRNVTVEWKEAGTYTLTFVVTANASPNCTATNSLTVTVNPLPEVSCEDIPLCQNDEPIVWCADPSRAAGLIETYKYKGVEICSFNPADSLPGDYTITYIVTNDDTGCVDSCDFTITVNALPALTCPLNRTLCSSDDPLDFGCDDLVNRGTPPSLTEAYFYDGEQICDFDPDEYDAGQYEINYVVTNDLTGCSDTCTFTITVVKAIESLSVTAVPSGDVCFGAMGVAYTANVVGGTGPFIYAWCAYGNGAGTGTCNGGFTPGGNNAMQTRNWTASPGARSVGVTVSQAGCPDQSKLYMFNVVADPIAPVIAKDPNETKVCAGETLTVTTTTPGSGGTGGCADEYRYSTDNGVTWSGWSTDVPFFDAVEGTNRVQSRRNCGGLGCNSNTNEVSWMVDPLPDVSISLDPQVICAGEEIKLSFEDNAATSHTFGITAILSDANGNVPVTFSGVVNGAMATYTEGTEFEGSATLSGIEVTDNTTGCKIAVDDLEVEVNALPETACQDTSICKNDDPIEWCGSPTRGAGLTETYKYKGVEICSFNPADFLPGDYTITYIVTNSVTGCVDSCDFTITVKPAPTATIGPVSSDPFTSVCVGQTAVFLASPAANASPAVERYGWTFSGMPTATGLGQTANDGTKRRQNVIYGPAAAGPQTVNLTVTYENGCSVTAATHTIMVNALPEVSCPTDFAVCVDADMLDLTNLGDNAPDPTTGTFSGPGVTSNLFDPATAGAGAKTITYMVTDINGCTNTCTFVITVNELPMISCPVDIIAVCLNDDMVDLATFEGFDPTDGEFSGPGVDDNMFDPNGDDTGPGNHTLTYQVEDENGCKNTCTFTITVNPLPNKAFRAKGEVFTSPFSGTIDFDADHDICVGGMANYGAFATIASGFSHSWAISGGGTIVSVSNGRQVRVHWTEAGTHTLTLVVTNTATGCTNTNTISVKVNALPEVSCPAEPVGVCIGGSVQLPAITPAGGDYSGTGVSDSGLFNTASGDQTITYTVTDANGCSNSCTFEVVVNDLPGITCPAAFSICLDDDPVALTGGTPSGGVYSGLGVDNGEFDPAEAGTGAKVITYTVTDGNTCSNTCTFTITVNPCITLSGKLIWQGDGTTGVSGGNVALSGDATDSDVSDGNGDYELTAPMGGSFVITPSKGSGWDGAGISVADVTALQQHLTGANVITDFYRLVASDVNRNDIVSTLDASILNQAILGSGTARAIISNNGVWRFVSTGYTVPNPAGPFQLPPFGDYNKRNVTAPVSLPGQDFYAVKAGDINNDLMYAPKPDPSVQPLVWQVNDRRLVAGELVEVEFSAVNFDQVAAFQHGLRFEPNLLRYVGIETMGSALNLDPNQHFGAYQAEMGELRASWAAATAHTLNGRTPVFRLRFEALASGIWLSDAMSLDADVLPAEAYSEDLNMRGVALQFVADQTSATLQTPDGGAVRLLQNRPNPFVTTTAIGFELPEACEAQLRVYDMTGRLLTHIRRDYAAGYHEELVELGREVQSGILMYELQTPFGVISRKMVMLK